MAARAFLGSPLNVADQGAYENTFLHVPQLKWEPLEGEKGATGLTAMPKGLLRAVLFGDPNSPGLCMFRMKYPPHYRVPPMFIGWPSTPPCSKAKRILAWVTPSTNRS
jgi:hypothetical protein